MTLETDDHKCESEAYEWTSWQSELTPPADNTYDMELLKHHQQFFGQVFLSELNLFELKRVCDNPTHMDAREVSTKISWVGSDSLLVYAHSDSIESNPTWSHGLSKSFG